MSTQALLGRFYLAAQSFTVNATGKATTAGHYFLCGYSGESTDQLCEHVQDLVDDVCAGATVGLSLTTGKVTIELGTTGSITWGSATELRDLLGFTGDLSGADTYLADNPARYAWAPQRNGNAAAMGEHPNALTAASFYDYASNTRLVRSKDGTATTVAGPLSTGEAMVGWRFLSKSSCRASAAPDPGTFEQLWLDCLGGGERVRLVLSASSYTSANYVECVAGRDDEVLGAFGDYCKRSRPPFDGLWDVALPLVEYAA
jgi:hypothetical protein